MTTALKVSSPGGIAPKAELPDYSGITRMLFAPETEVIPFLLEKAQGSEEQKREIARCARALVEAVRQGRHQQGTIDAFMQQYALSSQEGVVLMCLAEALLRIPDSKTADKLIADKIGGRDWKKHLGQSDSLFVNASAWGLMLTGRVIELGGDAKRDVSGYLGRLVSRSGEPVIRQAMRQAMKIMGKQFVLGRTIEEAIDLSSPQEEQGYRFSYDMLGEAAMTMEDADRYFESYRAALEKVGGKSGKTSSGGDIFSRPSLSVKLSALHPRYQERQEQRIFAELLPKIERLAQQARALDVGITIDAEEVDRLELSLALFGQLCHLPSLAGWNGLGLAVQAYSKRAYPVLEWLALLAKQSKRILPVRLVKGAYWDTEIKRAQEAGYEGYPLFTRKAATDVSYLACARYLLENRGVFYPQFATHNAHTVAFLSVMAGADRRFEFQRLHGMGQALYEEVVLGKGAVQKAPCRVYAPVGSHEDLLAYLVRRLLENGANTSFVNRLADDHSPIEAIIEDPVEQIKKLSSLPHPKIPLPLSLFPDRKNSSGLPLWNKKTRQKLLSNISATLERPFKAIGYEGSLAHPPESVRKITSPHDRSFVLGEAFETPAPVVEEALIRASSSFEDWDFRGGEERALILERAADLFEQNTSVLLALLIREAGKTLDNALADLREAVDFLRYYAVQARLHFSKPVLLPGPTGERNELSLHGRGVFFCISPWNFPLAIFTGQVAAALAAGNAVMAKPAEQTPLIAHQAVFLLHQAGVPRDVLALVLGDGPRIGSLLLRDQRISGVCFTGSNQTASILNTALAQRSGAIVPLIAETGGMNAMIMDSSALPEQAVRDVVASAFDSAGQRCSAARLLFVQEDVAPKVIKMLQGAMEELVIGDPLDYRVDIGPVIDEEAQRVLSLHKSQMRSSYRELMDLKLPKSTEAGTYVAPAAYELPDLSPLKGEVFGPILHVIPFAADRLSDVCAAINRTGYGLTLGLHTRIERTVEEVRRLARVGNMYVNRNQIGAVVGVQPFGGEGLSGTGPKAGGPHYLHRFATERTLSIDTTASGGNAALLSIEQGE